MSGLATPAQVAEALGISIPRVHYLLKADRIVGAIQMSQPRGAWVIPVDEEGKPKILRSLKRPRTFQKIPKAALEE